MKMRSFAVGLVVGSIIGFAITKIIKSSASTTINSSSDTASIAAKKIEEAKWKWPDSLDAVKAAPHSHRVLFENDKVRILEVLVAPYGFEPMHTHRFPSIMFGSSFDTSRFEIVYYRYAFDSARNTYFVKDSIRHHSGGPGEKAGNYMSPEGPHRIKNLSGVWVHAFRVEFKSEENQ